MGELKNELYQTRQLLRQSMETRMRAIQERISTADTFRSTKAIEIQFGEFDRARDHLSKLRSTIDGLIAHIDHPAHVRDELLKQQFRTQLAQIEQHLSSLDYQVSQPSRRGKFPKQ